jgi:hypothetical protein
MAPLHIDVKMVRTAFAGSEDEDKIRVRAMLE